MTAVYKAIGAVSAAMSRDGIGKNRTNTQGAGYKFRGIDDVLNALSSALVDAGLVILPRCTERVIVERVTKAGGAMFNVTCRVEFDLVSTEDGTKHTVCTYGEAMDSADKATNKAMSAAYKYLALLVFCIPTEASADSDADFTSHDLAVSKPAQTKSTLAKQEQFDAKRVANNLKTGIAAGDASGAASYLSSLAAEHLGAVWVLLDEKQQDALKAVWPTEAAA